MKLVLAGSWLLIGLASSAAVAQGCPEVDRRMVATALGLDPSLVKATSLEIPSCANIRVAAGEVSFVLDEQNLKVHNGVRSEIAIDYPFNEGDTVEYAWSVMLPSTNPPGTEPGPWWAIAQWHDQPDRRVGETWATFKGQPPPLSVYVERRNSVVGMGVSGLEGKHLSWAPVPLDTWLDIKATVHWSTGSDGSVEFQVADHPELGFSTTGRNMLNAYQHYLKLGQYRAPWVKALAVVSVRNLKISTRMAKQQ